VYSHSKMLLWFVEVFEKMSDGRLERVVIVSDYSAARPISL